MIATQDHVQNQKPLTAHVIFTFAKSPETLLNKGVHGILN